MVCISVLGVAEAHTGFSCNALKERPPEAIPPQTLTGQPTVIRQVPQDKCGLHDQHQQNIVYAAGSCL